MTESKIKILLSGGLGNQLFQYCYGNYLIETYGIEVLFDISRVGFKANNHGIDIRNFDLDGTFITSTQPTQLSYGLERLQRALVKKSILNPLKIVNITGTYIPSNPGYAEWNPPRKSDLRVLGHFQSWRYVSAKIRAHIFEKLSKANTSWYQDQLSIVRNPANVLLHIRRGDYASAGDYHGLLSTEYYRNSLRKFNEHMKIGSIVVFSDDEKLAQIVLSDLADEFQFKFITPPSSSSAVESMMLMSNAKNLVIANSSFSWWSARLNSQEKRVIVPDKWFKGHEDPLDLFDPYWLRVESHWEN